MELVRTNYTVEELVEMFYNGIIAIPEIQRDFVWKADRIKLLIDSIYKDFPSGAIILWQPEGFIKDDLLMLLKADRLDLYNQKPPKYLLLDGQQRLTALCSSILLEKEIGNYFSQEIQLPNIVVNYKTMKFEARKKLRKLPPNEILLNEILSKETNDSGLGYVSNVLLGKNVQDKYKENLRKLKKQVLKYSYPVQILQTGNYETVASIFKRVNKQGKTLVTAEIELANIIPHWQGISIKMRNYIKKCRRNSFFIDLPFVMRCLASVANNSAKIDILTKRILKKDFNEIHLNRFWSITTKSIDYLQNVLKAYLVDRSDFITTKNSMVPVVYTIAKSNLKGINDRELLKYILFSMAGNHYGERSETVLRNDFRILTSTKGDVRENFSRLLRIVFKKYFYNTPFAEGDFTGVYAKNSMILFMYLAFRYNNARDFNNTEKLPQKIQDIGKIHLHHIFPYNYVIKSDEMKTYMKRKHLAIHDIKAMVNDIANITFISEATNEAIKDQPPIIYFDRFTTKASRKAHCIPENKDLWSIDNFKRFMNERRKLLAKATNDYMKLLE